MPHALFLNIALKYGLCKLSLNKRGTFFMKFQIFGFADNINIVVRSIASAEEVSFELNEAALEISLKIHESKIHCTNEKANRPQYERTSQWTTSNFHEFVYLGIKLAKDGSGNNKFRR